MSKPPIILNLELNVGSELYKVSTTYCHDDWTTLSEWAKMREVSRLVDRFWDNLEEDLDD